MKNDILSDRMPGFKELRRRHPGLRLQGITSSNLQNSLPKSAVVALLSTIFKTDINRFSIIKESRDVGLVQQLIHNKIKIFIRIQFIAHAAVSFFMFNPRVAYSFCRGTSQHENNFLAKKPILRLESNRGIGEVFSVECQRKETF